MFSTGQIVFAISFALAFAGIIIWTYRKDSGLHRKNYKGVKWVGIGFVLFIILLFFLKTFLRE
ncbi:hypothetical protein [Sediminicola luteus]|jgi:hypothetical protein|uniref:Uncharacterized protein n=1 Tax=Sediminicola luteus TaxID=319238 RepID=A0A2A4G970_9FLAO|nr:hypothetical protein [Sediminicola luteus]PCE64312.1 hypothetical protein B7P33_08410 [Sediminicola luteus]